MTFEDEMALVPAWRDAGTITLNVPTRVALGDPCYGEPELVEGTLVPGEYTWQVRDLGQGGESLREWEARIRLTGSNAVDDWQWRDEYGCLADVPTLEDATLVALGIRSVDSGTMTWQLLGEDEHPWYPGNPWPGDFPTARKGGRELTTHTGWGDGGYLVAGRVLNEQLVEVRINFVIAPAEPLSTEEFATLWAKATFGEGVPVLLTVRRHWYRSATDNDDTRMHEEQYDTVTSLQILDTVYHDWYYEDALEGEKAVRNPQLVERIGTLWSRCPNPEDWAKREIVTKEEAGAPGGWIRESKDIMLELLVAKDDY